MKRLRGRLPVAITRLNHHNMRAITSKAGLRRRLAPWRRQRRPTALVPTMGCLHEGHLSLVRTARKRVGSTGKVVVSIYVNPTQFAPEEDWHRYPRELKRDIRLCRAQGVDLIFAPSDQQMYPHDRGLEHSTFVEEEQLSRSMEGASRPTHFRGVTTVVAKLLNLVEPDFAIFGAKDFQQAAVIKKMVRDLDFSTRIVVAPTKREADGLAISTRNRRLTAEERKQATVLWRTLHEAKAILKQAAGPIPTSRLKIRLEKFVGQSPAARLDYIHFFDPKTLRPARRVESGTHMAIAAFIGNERLIDNLLL